MFIILSWVLSIVIIAKVNEVRPYHYVDYNKIISNTIEKGILNVILILSADIIIYIIEICIICLKYKVETYYPSSYTPTVRNTYNDNQSNPVSTTRTNIIEVRQEKKYIVSLQRVLPYEVYSNLKAYIEKGKLILVALIDFYEQMNFEGLTEEQSITDEIIRKISVLSVLLDKMGDEVAKICIEFAHDTDALALLIQYLFPLIIRVIKINVEKGIYSGCQKTTSEQIIVLTKLEKKFETDEDGNVEETFRFKQEVSQASLENLFG